MDGFIIHPTYRTEDGKSFVHLYGRLESGESFVSISEFRPYFFILKSDLDKALKAESFVHEPSKLKDFSGEPVVKIVCDVPSQVKPLRDKLSSRGVRSFEADIRFAYRFMIDNGLQGALKISGRSEKGEFVDRVFVDPELSASDHFPTKFRVLSIDIETDMRARKLFSVSLVCGDYKRVFIVSSKKLKNADSFISERELLEAFKAKVLELDPDIITGWNLIDFDLKVLEAKFKEHRIPFALGRTRDACKLRLVDGFFQDSKADFPGRMVLDGIQLLKNNFISLGDYKLSTASEYFLKESKLIDDEDRGASIEQAYAKNQQLLVDYNLKDSELVLAILDKSTALSLSIQRSLLTGMPLDRIRASVASLDSVYLKELRARGFVAPTSGFEADDGEGKGGYVMASKPGIYDYIIVCDFKSLYPSIMRTFNIDPLSYVPGCKGRGLVKLPSGACFKKEDGIMPDIIKRLLDQRARATREKNEYARFAIKVLMNSFYGVLANPSCRFYNREMSNGITLTGQHIIKLAASKVSELGYEVIYGDTDSIFINLQVEDYKQAFKIGKSIASKINSFMSEHIESEYGRKSCLELEFEKVYKRFIMPRARGSEKGSKKRYAGLLVDEQGGEKMDFVGLEFVRRDWTELAKKFQSELLQRIFHKKEVSDYIRKVVSDLRAGKLDSELLYRKAIRKGVDEYVKTTPPHVKAARLLGDELKSSLIEYYMTLDGPEPRQKLKHKIDYEHYLEKQVKPIADSILGFYDQSFDDIVKGESQKTLFGF